MKRVHPIIRELNISVKAKYYFTMLELYEIIEDSIVLSAENQDINEARANYWSFKVDLKYCSKEDILEFYQSVIKARTKYLYENKISLKMVFYAWYEDITGNLYFSLIPHNRHKLLPGKEFPFGCDINKVEKLEEIIEEFINCPYKGIIKLDSLEDVNPDDDIDEERQGVYVNVWSCVL